VGCVRLRGSNMNRVLRWSLALSLLFALGVVATRYIPEPTSDAARFQQLFFESPECEIPCLLGIRPGMALLPAVERLWAHPWVHGVTNPDLFAAEPLVAWNWSGSQPDFIDASVPGYLHGIATMGDSGHVVTSIIVETKLRFYDVQQTLGSTDSGSALYWSKDDKITYDVSYYDPTSRLRTTLRADLACPAMLMHFYWKTHIRVSQDEGPLPQEYVPPEDLSSLCRRGRARR
jgi:hypothetical protein